MRRFNFPKQSTNLLIDTLITSGGGLNPYGKFSAILETFTSSTGSPPLLRHNLLLWLDTMGILDVDFQDYSYRLVKPVWIPTAISNRYVLIGALTMNEHEKLISEGFDTLPNNIEYLDYTIALPDTYCTNDLAKVEGSCFDVMHRGLFESINIQLGYQDVLGILEKHARAGALHVEDKFVGTGNQYFIYSFASGNGENEKVFFSQSNKIEKFNWRIRNYERCDLSEELADKESFKLIRVSMETTYGIKKYTLLLESCEGETACKYYYFDSKIVDERWARVIYLNKETVYDTFYDIKKSEALVQYGNYDDSGFLERRMGLVKKLDKNITNYSRFPIPHVHEFVEFDQHGKIKVPAVLKNSVMTYDIRNGILTIPKSVPLPTVFMRILFSCTGQLPFIFKNKFVPNPGYPVKLLYSGKLSDGGYEIPYPKQSYFIEEDVYTFAGVPKELADALSTKLGWTPAKMTFLKKIKRS